MLPPGPPFTLWSSQGAYFPALALQDHWGTKFQPSLFSAFHPALWTGNRHLTEQAQNGFFFPVSHLGFVSGHWQKKENNYGLSSQLESMAPCHPDSDQPGKSSAGAFQHFQEKGQRGIWAACKEGWKHTSHWFVPERPQ